ncbi:TetR/AcrR family transcriptional regulator [Sinorhizobium numidicum]|uniref:TetR/AcrR family transcriptional regulator n=1 Tax=Sinorhizobium numidicum TaxID=680248 RepID=A0ABY8CUQ6_9HYPH|nr:TetR/AcrR family transcriptional regulator [Sinorhizobium numidicum]WEX78988.1 TetR/AcrR family transcriptional regulator [Sinorhizobium numidicum]WEX82384.1 TetR/AcrR family transcriptional regulator [Sinorhizobium numidicum]
MMETRRIDRRVARTRKSLHRALISLILEKSYESITVEDICQAANVGRSTFYLHYTSKDNLKRSGLDSLRRELTDKTISRQAGRRHGIFDFSLAMFEHAGDHIELYRALAGGRGGAVALGTIRQILSDLVREELAVRMNEASSEAIPHELVVQYVVGAYMAVLTWWLDGGAKLPPERIDAIFRRLAMKGVTTGLEPRKS